MSSQAPSSNGQAKKLSSNVIAITVAVLVVAAIVVYSMVSGA